MFLDLRKAFDTLSHSVLLSKLDNYGIRGIANDWFHSYLSNRHLRYKLKNANQESYSDKYPVTFGAPQGSVLGPLLFLLFTNDLHKHLESCGCILFADDTMMYMSHSNLNYINYCIEQDLQIVADWFKANSLTLNLSKSVAMMFKPKNAVGKITSLQIKQLTLPLVKETKFLGVWLDDELNVTSHLNRLSAKIKRNVYLLRNHKNTLHSYTLKLIYLAQIQSHINYGLVLWGGMASLEQLNKLRTTQNKCVQLIKPRLPLDRAYIDLNLLNLDQLIDLEYKKLGYKISKGLLPKKMLEILNCDQFSSSLITTHNYNTRKKDVPNMPRSHTKCYQRSFLCNGLRALNSLNPDLLYCSTITSFVKKCKQKYASQ